MHTYMGISVELNLSVGSVFFCYPLVLQIKAFLVNNHIQEEDIVAMEVPKYNQTQFNTGLAMFHLRTDEAVAHAVNLKGTYIGDR